MAEFQIELIVLMKVLNYKKGDRTLKIRLATKDDFDFFFKLKSEDYNIFWTGGKDKPIEENIKKFFFNAIERMGEKDTRKIYIVENEEGEKVGHLYIIPNGNEFDLPCAILKDFSGRGYAKQAIKLGLAEGKRLGFKRMVGKIREDNIASLKAYTACGIKVLDQYEEVYIPKLEKNVKMNFVVYEYD